MRSPGPAAGPARGVILLALLLGLAAAVAAAVPLSLGVRHATSTALYCFAALAVVLGLRRHRPTPLAPWAGLAAYAAMNALASVLSVGLSHTAAGVPASPWLGDALWLGGDAVLAGALYAILRSREVGRIVLLDVAAIATSVALVGGAIVLGHYEHAGVREATPLAYVVADVLLLSLALRLAIAPRPQGVALRLVTVAVVALVASDVLWQWLAAGLAYAPGAWADLGWIAHAVLTAVAASLPSMTCAATAGRASARLRMSSAVVLAPASLAAPVLLALQSAGVVHVHDAAATAGVLAGGGLIALVLFVRVSALIRQSQHLTDRLEEALAERARRLDASEQRYRTLVEQLPGVVYIGAFGASADEYAGLYVSPQIERIVGISQDAWLEDTGQLRRLVVPEDRARFAEHVRHIHAGLEPRPFDFRLAHPEDGIRWLRSEYSYVDGGEHRMIQGILLDVTALREAMAERDTMEADLRLAQKLEAVGQLAAGIAHEINTPIQFVGDTVHFLDDAFVDLIALVDAYERLQAELADGEPSLPTLEAVAQAREIAEPEYLRERLPRAFERAFDGVGRVSRIVRAMREFGHPPTTEKVPIDVNTAIETTLVVAASEYKYVADVELSLGDVPPVVANAGDVNQAILNLVVNAAHAIQDRLGEGSDARGRIAIATAHDGEDVVVRIGDDGCGIPPDVAERIFDPFFTTKEVGRGTGQGLAILHRAITQRHGGSITFESVPGQGTTFEVRLPIEAAEREPAEEAVA